VGDQTWSGNILINLPDLSELKVKAEVNEVDISKIKIGQKVLVKLDAFSDTSFNGTVTHVANLANFKEGSNKIKVFPIEILIEGTSDKLMPGHDREL
jgi:HlyD family secretion protein